MLTEAKIEVDFEVAAAPSGFSTSSSSGSRGFRQAHGEVSEGLTVTKSARNQTASALRTDLWGGFQSTRGVVGRGVALVSCT